MKLWPVVGIVFMQVFLCLAHLFLYHTWISFLDAPSAAVLLTLRIALTALSFSFIAAALLSFRSIQPLVRIFYTCAAAWLGFLNLLFWAACASWFVWYALLAVVSEARLTPLRPWIGAAFAAAALLAGLWGLVVARRIHVRHTAVALQGLPANWRGRKALLISDLHLGHVNGVSFSRRIVEMASALAPDIVFIPGDLFDGGQADSQTLLEPFRALKPPHGIYFSSGNHDEFGDMAAFTRAIEDVGIRVLSNESVRVDGLSVLGVPFGDSTFPIRMRATLKALLPAPGEAAVLLNHVPSRLPIVEEAGVALQLSGHTHSGQIFPFTWLTRRIFGTFTHGLSRYGALTVVTSSGAGTWGPPMRIGSRSEMVLLTFEEQKS